MINMIIKPFFSVWVQLGSLSFCLAGQFSDLLIIRLCLTSAYVFTFINSITGGPLWPHLILPNHIQLDQVCWATINLYVHISTVVRLLNDERIVKSLINNHEKLALWRMFFRTGGLSQKVFEKTISNYCNVITYNKDDILDTDTYFYIIYQGTVKMTVTDDNTNNSKIISSRYLQSGQLFDFRSLGLLIDYSNILAKQHISVITISKQCIVFRFIRKQMSTIVKNPNTKLLWKEILMENMLRIVQTYFDKRLHQRLIQDELYIHPIYDILEINEIPHPYRAGSTEALCNPFYHIYKYMVWSFAPPWPFQGPPTGLRHTQLLIGTGTGRKHIKNNKDKDKQQHQQSTISSLATDEEIQISINESTSLISSNNATINKNESSSTYTNDNNDNELIDYMPSLNEYTVEQVAWGMYGLGFIPATGIIRRSPSSTFLNQNGSSDDDNTSNDALSPVVLT